MEQEIYQKILNNVKQICFYLKAFISGGTKGGCRAVASPPPNLQNRNLKKHRFYRQDDIKGFT